MPQTVLVADDDRAIRESLTRALELEGYEVVGAADGVEVLTRVRRDPVDALVLDVMMPALDGIGVCRVLRADGDRTPVLMLTARVETPDRVAGLDAGADDYLPKPFNPRELVARINAVLRRQAPKPPPGAPTLDERVVRFGQVEVNLAARTLTRNGQEQVLTTGEFSLLRVLLESPRVPLSRDKLMELARGREYDAYDRSIDVQMSRLRKLVEDDPAKPRYLQTVWGFGYVFVPDGARHG